MESLSTCMFHLPFNKKGQDHITCPFQCEEFPFRCKTQWDYCHPVWQQENHETSTPVRGWNFKTSQDPHMPPQPQQRQGKVMKYCTYHKVCCSPFSLTLPLLFILLDTPLSLPSLNWQFLSSLDCSFTGPLFTWLFLYCSILYFSVL